MANKDLLLSSYNYQLPAENIAQFPTLPAHNAKLLICNPESNGKYAIQDGIFFNLKDFLDNSYLIFLNNTKVFKARIPLKDVKVIRSSGKTTFITHGEIFIYSIIDSTNFECLVSDDKNFKPGSSIFFSDGTIFHSLAFTENGILFSLEGKGRIHNIFDFLEQAGEMPLPPYITYEKDKEKWYQTFFAEEIGSAAAPTASLHFTPELINLLRGKGVSLNFLCLHVGLGTFKPIYKEHIEDQKLHTEPMIISNNIREYIYSNKQKGKIFLPVGTTMVRYLESLPYIWIFLQSEGLLPTLPASVQKWWNTLTEKININLVRDFIPDQEPEIIDNKLVVHTRLFIKPGIKFYLVDEIITNFHLPKSSLMMLIAAFMGRENLINTYNYAIQNNYKFYSFGDGMRIRRSSC